jgi:hypothetical protein
MINIHVASINRSGASLMTRLFDGHPDVASYPVEFNYPWNPNIYPFIDRLTGSPNYIPDYDPAKTTDILKFLDIPENEPKKVIKWGKEKANPIGISKNYLERELYNTVKTDFDYDKFIRLLLEFGKTAKNIQDIYDTRHKSFFDAWENGKYAGTMKYVATYGSGQLFISNIEKYFKEFPSSFLLCPIRNVTGYIASEKTRYARMYYGARRFAYPRLPNVFVKAFSHYDLEAHIRSWLVTITRIALLQERLGIGNGFVVYRYENLVNNTEVVMKSICEKIGLSFHQSLLTTTIAGQVWGGSSHQGRQTGVNKDLISYYPRVLRNDELVRIEKACGPVLEFLNSCETTPIDLMSIPKDILYDYSFQKRYFDDEEKLALYSALAFSGRRKVSVGPPDASAISALVFARLVRIMHIPRMLKLKLFPGLGKQNYR